VEYLLNKDFGALKIDWYKIYEKIYDRKNDKVYDDLPEILIRAADDGDFTTVNILILAGVDPTANDNAAIIVASFNGHVEVVKLLLQQPRADPTADNNYAIREASENGYIEVVKLLLEQPGVDPTAEDNEAIRKASENGYLEVVKLLQEYGASLR